MVDIVSMAAGVVTFGCGYLVGYFSGKEAQRSPRAECRSCDHGVGYHTDRVGKCQLVRAEGDICSCAHYDSPLQTED